ncbi:MAG: family 20 glycosylhydrolase [Bacteroidaceae bacterium]|nr:family 20 glycosylhydrolase [Bacteroidaceae bacterium]
MKRFFTLICLFLSLTAATFADIIVTEQLSVTKGAQIKESVKADVFYIISGIDQSSVEHYLYDNGGQVKGTTPFPSNSESTASHLWTLKASGDNWFIVNVATGNYMNLGSSNGSAIKTSATTQENSIHFDSNGYLTILNSNGQAIDMTANGANPTTWSGTTTPDGSRCLKIYEVENVKTESVKSLSLIPAPKSVSVGDGEFILNKGFTISVEKFSQSDEQNKVLADVARFITTVNVATELDCKASYATADIVIKENHNLAPEGYIMDITPKGVTVEASTSDGVYYAMQSLMRLLPPNVILGKKGDAGQVYALPVARIEDEPRFSYRGFMLDVSRHFFTIEQVKKMIDLMAIYKMNVFHWHLTDDQGWRAEIKQYPLLTSKGAERKSSYDTPITRVEENGQVYWTGEGAQTNRHYGPFYYTQEEMRDVVRYAAERHIDVLPEVDMPGHFVAALAAYPQYSCHPNQAPEVWTTGGVSTDVLNVANPETVQFAKNIITELCDIFPYPYFHIGGDECPTSQWESNALCQAKLSELGKNSYRALQTEFIREINEHLTTLGKKIFCWNESITDAGADLDLMKGSGATIMCWTPCQSAAAKAAYLGLNAIITEYGSGCYYINRRQSNDYGEPTAAGGGGDIVSATYNYVPVPSNVSAKDAKYYIGVQATFWTEHVSSNEYLEYLALPRFMCVAEAGWTPQEKKDWKSFVRRMTIDTKMLDLGEYIYARHWMDDYTPRQAPAATGVVDGTVVTFTNKSTDRGDGRCLDDNNGTLTGQGTAGTKWTLEKAPTEGCFYIRSNVSGNYLYAADGNSGTMVQLSTEKTEWAFDTSTLSGYVAICYNSVSGNAINNNVSNTTFTRLFAHGSGNGASFWIMEMPVVNELEEGEHGVLTYNYYYRGITVGRKEFSLVSGSAYPSCKEYVPNGFAVTETQLPTGTVHLKNEIVEIAVERIPEMGRYYRFLDSTQQVYLSTAADLEQTYTYTVAGGNQLFYYNNSSIMAYERGLFLSGGELLAVGDEAPKTKITPALTGNRDVYNIVFDDDKYLYMADQQDVYTITGSNVDAAASESYDIHYRYVLSLPVELDENGWATFSAPVPVAVPQECAVYIAEKYDADNAILSMKLVEPGTVIAANTGVVLKAAPSTTVEFVISESGINYSGNLLQPSVMVTSVPAEQNAYVPVYVNGTICYRVMDATERILPPHSSWLLMTGTNVPEKISVVFLDDDLTSVKGFEAETVYDKNIYNLSGQRITTPQIGVNIINGKKVLVK